MEISIESVTRRFGRREALREVSIRFPSGELTSILGPSGCGKSTLLSIIAGILEPSAGTVRFDGTDVTSLPPDKRKLGFVFQNYALYPHLTVAQNVGYPLRFMRDLTAPQRAARVQELAALVKVDELLGHRPAELSGGQQQRVAIARALAKRPGVVLLDEPLSNLDARLRSEMRTEIRRIQSESGVTMVLVTHDQEDALAVSDTVVVMRAGQVEQISGPIQTYAEPQSLFVADFIGEPPASQIPVAVAADGIVSLASGMQLPLRAPVGVRDGKPVVLAVRAEAVQLVPLGDDPSASASRVVSRSAHRQAYLYDLALDDDTTVRASAPGDLAVEPGEPVGYRIDASAAYYFDAASGKRRS